MLRKMMTSKMTILIRFFPVSTRLFKENNRLKPWRGLRRLNFGLIDSVLTRKRVCAKVAATAHRMDTATTGPTVLRMTMTACMPTSPDLLTASWGFSPMEVKHRDMNPPSCSTKMPVTSQRTAKVPRRLATATASRLIKTLPFFRSSRRFFGVAFSVLFPSGKVCPPLRSRAARPPEGWRSGD